MMKSVETVCSNSCFMLAGKTIRFRHRSRHAATDWNFLKETDHFTFCIQWFRICRRRFMRFVNFLLTRQLSQSESGDGLLFLVLSLLLLLFPLLLLLLPHGKSAEFAVFPHTWTHCLKNVITCGLIDRISMRLRGITYITDVAVHLWSGPWGCMLIPSVKRPSCRN